MYTSQPTVRGGRPVGMPEARPFGVEDRPLCLSCAAEMHLFRRSPEPGRHTYEVQIFSCMKCDAEITRSVDCKGKPHTPTVLGLIRVQPGARLPAPSMVDEKPAVA